VSEILSALGLHINLNHLSRLQNTAVEERAEAVIK